MEIDAVHGDKGKQQCEQQHDTSTSWFVFSWNCVVHDGNDLHADGGSRAVWLAL